MSTIKLKQISSLAFYETLQYLRALKLLENIIGYKETLRLLEEDISPITFSEYPPNELWLLKKRETINNIIGMKGCNNNE